MFNKSGGKVRLTFKLEQDQLWIGTKGGLSVHAAFTLEAAPRGFTCVSMLLHREDGEGTDGLH